MTKENYLYGVPYEWYENHQVRKYGFHGTSHKYVSIKANAILGKEDTKVITCHIGNGASITAIKNGKCVDTSMGLTPNSGLIMGSRSGDLDVTVLPYIMKKTDRTVDQIAETLNKQSGILGISGISNDLRDIEDTIKSGNERSLLAHNIYVKKIVDYIAMYYVLLGGCDMLVFTAGVGEKSPYTRKQVLNRLAVLGIYLNEEANNSYGKEVKISTDESKFLVYVIPTNEELMIANDTYNLVKE